MKDKKTIPVFLIFICLCFGYLLCLCHQAAQKSHPIHVEGSK